MKAAFHHQAKDYAGERGVTLLELLVGLGFAASLLTLVTVNFFKGERDSLDHRLKGQTRNEVRAIFDLMSFDLRTVGSGMGLGQSDFTVAQVGGDAPLPVLPGARETDITLRVNETGGSTVLTSTFATTGGSTAFSIFNPTLFKVDDTLYFSNAPSGGEGALQGQVASVSATGFRLKSGYFSSPGAVFPEGSSVERIEPIRYYVTSSGGIARTRRGQTTVIAPRGSFLVQYLDQAGTPLSTPLTSSQIEANLSSVELTVRVSSERLLSSREFSSSSLTQRLQIRNLFFARF